MLLGDTFPSLWAPTPWAFEEQKGATVGVSKLEQLQCPLKA